MALIALRENTALRPGRLRLVPTGWSFSSSFALPARRGPAYANARKMILLHDSNVKWPGIILLHKMTVRPGSESRANDVSPGNPFRICTLDESRSRQERGRKSFTMISLCDYKNNLPGMILLRKKVGVPPPGALSMPKWLLSREAKSSRATNRSGGPLRAIPRGLSS